MVTRRKYLEKFKNKNKQKGDQNQDLKIKEEKFKAITNILHRNKKGILVLQLEKVRIKLNSQFNQMVQPIQCLQSTIKLIKTKFKDLYQLIGCQLIQKMGFRKTWYIPNKKEINNKSLEFNQLVQPNNPKTKNILISLRCKYQVMIRFKLIRMGFHKAELVQQLASQIPII